MPHRYIMQHKNVLLYSNQTERYFHLKHPDLRSSWVLQKEKAMSLKAIFFLTSLLIYAVIRRKKNIAIHSCSYYILWYASIIGDKESKEITVFSFTAI